MKRNRDAAEQQRVRAYGKFPKLGKFAAPAKMCRQPSRGATRPKSSGVMVRAALQAIVDAGFRYQKFWVAWVKLDLLT
jgi:hypothetical protein